MSDIVFGMQVDLEGDGKVNSQIATLDKNTDKLSTSLDKSGKEADQAGDKIDKFGKDAETAGKKTKGTTGFLKSMFNQFFSLKGLIAGLGMGLLTADIIEVGNVTEGWSNALFAVTESHVRTNQELQHARDLALRLGTDIRGTTNSYVQFTAATEDTALQGFKTTKVFDAVTSAMRVMNRSADDTSGALKALEQMVSKGNVQAEELRGQLGERLPGAFSLAAQAMGVTTQELNKMLEQGQVLAVDLLPKLADILEKKFGPGVERAIKGPSQGFRDLSNSFFLLKEAFANELFAPLATGAKALSDSIDALLPQIGSILNVLLTLVEIVAIGGVLYLGFMGLSKVIVASRAAMAGLSLMNVQFAAGALISAASNWTFNKSLTATIALSKATIASVGVMKLAFLSLFAVIAGWQIGKLLSDEFVQVRVAGLAFIGAMETGFVNLGYAFDVAMAGIKSAWSSSLDFMKEAMASFYGGIGSLLSKIGLDSAASIYTNAAASWRDSADSVGDLSSKIAELTLKRDEDIAKIDEVIVALVAQELGIKKVNKANADAGDDSGGTEDIIGKVNANQAFIESLETELYLSQFIGKELAIQTALKKLDAEATDKQIAKVRELAASIYDHAEAVNAAKQDDDFYQNAIDGVNGYSDAWSSAGNVIIDTFGNIGQQMQKLFESENAYAKALEINHKKQQEQGADTKKLRAEEYQLNVANTQAQLNSYSAIAGAAADMFDEKTAAAKTFHAIEQAMAIASLAMSVKKMTMGTTETGVHIANEGAKQSANGLTAITSAFAAPFPVNFIAGAAMVGIIASLLGQSFGGSGSESYTKPTSGTGTVLGSDESSESVSNAFDDYEDIALDQLAELMKISGALTGLTSGIAQLAASLVKSSNFGGGSVSGLGTERMSDNFMNAFFGGERLIDKLLGGTVNDLVGSLIGGISKTKKTLIDTGLQFEDQEIGDILSNGFEGFYYNVIETTKSKLWGLSKNTSYNTELSEVEASILNEVGAIFGYLAQTVGGAIEVLGVDAANELESYVVDLGSISFEGLTGDEIQSKLEAVISTQGDLFAEYVFPQITQYQQIGEGALETLLRVTQEQVVFNDNLERMGVTLTELSNIEMIDVAQNIIELVGGLDAFQEASNTFFTEFYSEAEQFDYLQKSLTEALGAMNAELPESAQLYREMVEELGEGLATATEEEQRLYAQLLLLSGQSADYYDALDEQISKEAELTAARKAFNDDVAAQLAQLDFSPLEASLNSLNNQYMDDLANAIELGADVQLLEVFYGKQRTAIIEEQLQAASDTFDTEIASIANTLDALVDSIVVTRESLASNIRSIKKQNGSFDEVGFINANIAGLYGEFGSGSIDEQIDVVESLNDYVMQRYELELEQQQALSDAGTQQYELALEQYDNLKSALASVEDYSKGLSLSNYSPLSASSRLNVAASNFSSDVQGAFNFDLTAIENLSNSADAYLEEARNMFGSSSQFSAIFSSVQSSLNQISSLDVDAPDPLTAAEIYQSDALKLQTDTIAELQNLSVLLNDLESQAYAQSDSDTAIATEQFNTQVALIDVTNELSQAQLEKQQKQIDLAEKNIELSQSQLAQQKETTAELTHTVAQQAQIIDVLQKQLTALNEGNRTQAATYDKVIVQRRQA